MLNPRNSFQNSFKVQIKQKKRLLVPKIVWVQLFICPLKIVQVKILLRPHNIFWGDLEFVCSKNTFGLEKHLEVKQKRGAPKFQDYVMISIRDEGGRGQCFGLCSIFDISSNFFQIYGDDSVTRALPLTRNPVTLANSTGSSDIEVILNINI